MDEDETEVKTSTLSSSMKLKLSTLFKNKDVSRNIKDKVLKSNQAFTEAYFLLNMYVLKQLEENKIPNITATTICRCANLIIPDSAAMRGKDEEIKILENIYNTVYPIDHKPNIESFKSINRPIEYMAKQILVNIKNHCSIHFFKYQFRYIYSLVIDKTTNLNLKKHILAIMTKCIQCHINNNKASNELQIISKNLLEHEQYAILKRIIGKIIDAEKDKIPNEFRYKDEYITKGNLKSNYCRVLKYYFEIIKQLEKSERKRFSILPQLNLGLQYVKFDKRLLCIVYNETYNKNIPIKTFEAQFRKYYKIMFKPRRAITQMFSKFGWNKPCSFMTDGYSAVLLFEKKIEIIETDVKEDNKDESDAKKKKSSRKIDLEEEQVKKGLYDADNCRCSEGYLNEFYKIGIDPNNENMIFGMSETEKRVDITKSYYREISCINKIQIKINRYLKNKDMRMLYNQLSSSSYKTTKRSFYEKYILIIRQNWEKIWNTYSSIQLLEYYYDLFVKKRKAISIIIRQIVPKNRWKEINQKINLDNTNKYFDKERHAEIMNKPVLIAFGKGRGDITISNLKNNSPKGPIKKIAKELSRFCLVVLTDEFRTSQLCSDCKSFKLVHPKTDFKIKFKKNPNSFVKKECHDLCICKNNTHSITSDQDDRLNVHKFWQRDVNAARNILFVMKQKLQGNRLGYFSRNVDKSKIPQVKPKTSKKPVVAD